MAQEKPWWPVKVNSYYGIYDVKTKKPGRPAASLTGPKVENWTPPQKANKPYTIGVSFPHLKDPYWLAVDYGIISEAKRLGIGVSLVAAEGYTDLAKQVSQVENLAQQGVDGIILGSISYTSLDPVVEEIDKKGIPVVEVINDIQAPAIRGKALVSFFDMGYHAGNSSCRTPKARQRSTSSSFRGLPGRDGRLTLSTAFRKRSRSSPGKSTYWPSSGETPARTSS